MADQPYPPVRYQATTRPVDFGDSNLKARRGGTGTGLIISNRRFEVDHRLGDATGKRRYGFNGGNVRWFHERESPALGLCAGPFWTVGMGSNQSAQRSNVGRCRYETNALAKGSGASGQHNDSWLRDSARYDRLQPLATVQPSAN